MPKTSDAEWDEGPSLLEIALRYWWLLLISALVCSTALFFLAQSQPFTYATVASLLLEEPESEGLFAEADADDHDRYVQNQVKRLQSREVAVRAAEIVGGGATFDEILDSITVDVEVDNDLVTITGTAATPERAAAIANAVGEAYQDVVRGQVRGDADAAIAELETTKAELRRELRALDAAAGDGDGATVEAQRDALVAQLAELQATQDQIRIDRSLYGSGVQLFERAPVPAAPQSRGAARLASLGVLVGLALGTALAWFLTNRAEDEADRRHDPAAILQAPLLGAVPDFKGLDIKGSLPTITDPRSPAAEAYQFVVALLSTQFNNRDGSNVILVTSPQPGDGKTVTAVNLAVAASRDEREVLLVDADARVAGLSRMVGVHEGAGLHELQQDPENLVWSESRRDMPNVPSMEVVPVGSEIPDPAGFFRTSGFGSAIRRIRDYADFVVIDSPPILAVSDTAAIADHVDGIVLVIPQGTSLAILEEVKERLALIKAPLLGYIFNRADTRSAPYAYRYDRYTSSSSGRSEVFSARANAQPLQP